MTDTAHSWLARALAEMPETVTSLSVRADLDDRDDDHPRLCPRIKATIVGTGGATYAFASTSRPEPADPSESCIAGWEALYDLADDLQTETRDFIHTLPIDDGWVTLDRREAVDPRGATERPPAFGDVKPVPALEAEAYRDVAIAMQSLPAGKAMLLHVERDDIGVLTWRRVRP